jgi:nucleotide-binding universal stress UspA family protein
MITQLDTQRPTTGHAGKPATPLLAVVGYDGTAPSAAALDAAIRLIDGRAGHLAVVWVAHVSSTAAMSAEAEAGLRQGFGPVADELDDEVRAIMDDREPRWSFQRRDGSVAHELVAAAKQLRRQQGPEPTIVIIVGAPVQRLHHMIGSVPVALAREAKFPLLVVPSLA